MRPGTLLPNGATVIDMKQCPRFTVLFCMRPGAFDPFVTWIAPNDRPMETEQGHYHNDFDTAVADYRNRIRVAFE